MSMFNECHIHLCDCTWLNVFHILNFCWSNTKIFLSVLIVFGKSFVFKKNSKTVLRRFGDLVAGQSSRMPPVGRSHRRYSHLTSGSMSQSRKRLIKFFKILGFKCFRNSVWWLVCEWKLQLRGYTKIFVAPFTTSS